MTTKNPVIYVQLLDEGTTVYRPTRGERIFNDIYKVLPTENYDPEDEHWEFVPGTLVKCSRRIKNGKKRLYVIEEYLQIRDSGS